ncbi:MAG TPA: response regulator [Chitinophagaceae bacterium]
MPEFVKPKRILFADDDPDDHYLFLTALKEVDKNIEVVQFYQCDGIVEYLKENNLPDILFLDLNMPGNEELKCLMGIKKNEQFKSIRVIIYTTSHSTDLIDTAYKNGANKYVVKPGSIRELQNMLRDIIEEPDESSTAG